MDDVVVGQLLDKKYRIVRLLGQGGMGAVYEGENVRIHHRVAIKVLHPGIASDSGAVERFEREAQAAGKIGSEHIVEVYDLGEMPSGARYMVMEFLEGETLAGRLERGGPRAPSVAATFMLQMLEGLGAAHAAGIIHRDLKPDNIFLQRTRAAADFVKIVDFGVSKFNSLSGGSGMSMTRTGSIVGTPYYMSPEQLKGSKHTDHRSDLYSAGVVLFETVTGDVPFKADTLNELMFKIVLEPPTDPEQAAPGLDPAFAEIIRKAMIREPDKRYQSASEFGSAILEWMSAAGVAAMQPTTVLSVGQPRPPIFNTPDPRGTSLAGPGSPAPLVTQVAPSSMAKSVGGPVPSSTGGALINTPVPTARPNRALGLLVAGGVAVLATAVVAIVLLTRGTSETQRTQVSPSGAAPATESTAAPPSAAPGLEHVTLAPAAPSASAASEPPTAGPKEPPPSGNVHAHGGPLPVASHHGTSSAGASAGAVPAPPVPVDTATLRGRTVHTQL